MKFKIKKNIKKTIEILFIVFFFVMGLFFLWVATLQVPSIEGFRNREVSNSTKIYDRTGEIVLYDIHKEVQRTLIKSDMVSDYVKNAMIAIEDHSFYEHNGVVWKSTIRGAITTLKTKFGFGYGGSPGGSTITQQVIKNTILTNEKSITRKVKEWVLAYKLEKELTKEEILEIYINEVPFGGVLYGVKEASNSFFGKEPIELTLAESAYIASIPNRPTFYSPYGNNKDKLENRKNTVLAQMLRHDLINKDEYEEAINEEVEFTSQDENTAKALHMVQYIRAYLEEEYGIDVVENGGLKVVSTIDWELQKKAEETVLKHSLENEELYNASNSGLVALDPMTGQILAMVGSRDYFDEGVDGAYNVTLAERQPGSSFKPIVYSAAFERGFLPETVIFDTQTQFNARCEPDDLSNEDGCYAPRNYDREFRGPLSMRSSLAESRNISAVKTLYLVGIRNAIEQAKKLGITTLDQDETFYGLTLVLGGGETSLLEMTSAYSVFAQDGTYNKPVSLLQVLDRDGEILEEFEPDSKDVLEPNVARMISSILSDNIARAPLFGTSSFMHFGSRDVAAKTGTTNDNKDAWLIGYTPNIAVGVWVGNNDNTPMSRGSSIAGGPWREFMNFALAKIPNKSFGSYSLPANFENLPPVVQGKVEKEKKIFGATGDFHSILHWINKNNPQGLGYSRNDDQYESWELGVKNWITGNSNLLGGILSNIGENVGEDKPPVIIEMDSKFGSLEKVRIVVEGDFNGIDVKKVNFYINSSLIGNDRNEPYKHSFVPYEEEDIVSGENTMSVLVIGEDGEKLKEEKVFIIE